VGKAEGFETADEYASMGWSFLLGLSRRDGLRLSQHLIACFPFGVVVIQ
jgi:hypothetical protein